MVDNVSKKIERKEKDETAKKGKSETKSYMSREIIEAWTKDDAFKFWDTVDGKPVTNNANVLYG